MWLKPSHRGFGARSAGGVSVDLVDSEGERIRLGKSLGEGREGAVHEILGSQYVAKVYRAPNRTPERRHKLHLMVAHPPVDPTQGIGHISICWPLKLVFEFPDRFAGFVMPRVDTANCPQLLRFVFPKYYPQVFSWRNQFEIAANLAGALAALHEAGYVVGDLNLKNIHVTQSCLVTSVDCDSFQVPDPAEGRVLRCDVGVAEYTAPEFQGLSFSEVDRTASSDVFAFSVILCQLLLAGLHPFAGGAAQTREENIGAGDSIFRRPDLPRASVPLEVLPPGLLDLLERCFNEGHRDPSRRPAMKEYAEVLQGERKQIRTCKSEPERHTFGGHVQTCPWCEMASQSGFDPYRHEPRKPKPRPPAPVSQTKTNAAVIGLHSYYRRALFRHRLRRSIVITAVLLAFIVAGSVAWNILEAQLPAEGTSVVEIGGVRVDVFGGLRKARARIREEAASLWNRVASGSKPTVPESAAPAAEVASSPALDIDTPVLCTGLDSRGEPIPPRSVLYEADAASRMLSIYVRFRNATPGKTSLQVRWLIAGKQDLFSSPFTADTSDGAILVPYRSRLVAGSYQVSVVADGVVRGSVIFSVHPGRKRETAPATPKQAAHPVMQKSPPSKIVKPPVSVDKPTEVTLSPRQPQRRVFKARHKHRLGTCSGELIVEVETMTFTSSMHSFRWERRDVKLHEDGIENPEGKRWHFVIEGQDARELLSRWLQGGLRTSRDP